MSKAEREAASPADQPFGAHYTEPEMVRSVTSDVLGPLCSGVGEAGLLSLRILDPSCGDGAFLIGIAEHLIGEVLSRRGHPGADPSAAPADLKAAVARCLIGVDVDPEAIAACRARLTAAGLPTPGAQIFRSNALHPGGAGPGVDPLWRVAAAVDRPGGFDAVIGNPPYLGAVALSAADPALRAYCGAAYPRAATGAWDLYCVFIERALSLTRPGGRHGFVVPSAVCAAEYARGARRCVAEAGGLSLIRDLRGAGGFDAHVYPISYAMTVAPDAPPGSVRVIGPEGETTGPATVGEDPWWLLDASASVDLDGWVPLSALATVSGAATVAEAYALAPLLSEAPDGALGPDDLPVINSGTIDPLRSLWGEKPMRYLGMRLRYPVVSADQQAALPPRRLAQARSPKVIVAGLGRSLEVFPDVEGRWLAGKSTVVLLPHPGVSVRGLAGLLSSKLITDVYRARYGALAMRGGYMRVGPPQLRALPLPDLRSDLDLASRISKQVDGLMGGGESWSALEDTVRSG